MRMGVARHALLVDDPRQGAGWWIFPDETALLNDLGVALAEDISDGLCQPKLSLAVRPTR